MFHYSSSENNWHPGSGVVLDCIDSRSLHPYLLCVVDPCGVDAISHNSNY